MFGAVKAPEVLVKAAIVYNLDSYIYWPKNLPSESLTIAVLGNSPIYDVLSHFKEIGGDKNRRLRVVHIDDLKSYQSVHILYVSEGYTEGVMKKLKQKPVMLVGEGFGCWQENLHICMIKEGAKYRLKIDPISFETSGLDLDPELIELIQI